MHKLVIAIVVGITSTVLAADVGAAPGDVDPTFGVGGSARIDIGYFDDATDLAIQQDRKIVAVGTVSHEGGGRNVFAVRLRMNGSLDPGFGSGGIVVPDRYHQVGPRVALQPDGKIVLATRGETDGGSAFLYRFDTDGTPDDQFGTNGIATLLPPAAVSVSWVAGVGILTDGKIVVVLWVNTQEASLAFARFNTDGSPDGSFGTGGFVVVPGYRIPYGFALQPDGLMLVVGAAFLPGRFYSDAFVARFHEDGTLDSSFDTDGIALVQQPSTGTDFRTVALAEDGSMFAGGREFGDNPYESRWLLAKFETGGARDSAFGSTGLVSHEPGPGEDAINDLLVDSFGIYGAGVMPSSSLGLPVALFQENGQFDPAFGVGGFTGTPELSAFGTSRIALQSRGMVIAFGSIQSWEPSFNQDLHFTRYEGFGFTPYALNPRSRGGWISTTLEPEPSALVELSDVDIHARTVSVNSDGAGIELTLEGAVPNPSTQLSATFMLPDAGPATLVAYDVKGRLVGHREVGGLALGRHVIQLRGPGELPPGVYLVHLIQGHRHLVSRAVVVR